MPQIFYRVEGHQSENEWRTITTDWVERGRVLPEAFEQCAEDFYDMHDGCYVEWPVTIVVSLDPDHPARERCEVELENQPIFTATPL